MMEQKTQTIFVKKNQPLSLFGGENEQNEHIIYILETNSVAILQGNIKSTIICRKGCLILCFGKECQPVLHLDFGDHVILCDGAKPTKAYQKGKWVGVLTIADDSITSNSSEDVEYVGDVDENFKKCVDDCVPDPVVASLIVEMSKRCRKGLEKYGTTTEDNPLSIQQWLQHGIEENLDSAAYLRKLQKTLNELKIHHFPFTNDGYQRAKRWMKSQNMWNDEINAEDGMSIVYMANMAFDKQIEKNEKNQP